MTLRVALTALALVSACLHVRAEYRGPRAQVYLFKPLTVACLLLLVLTVSDPAGWRYQAAIGAGLCLSIAGDVFLMLPGDRFLPGLSAFLLAHLCYIAGFTTGVPPGGAPLLFVPYALAGAVMLGVLWPGLGKLRMPVSVYVLVIVVMAWQAGSRAVLLGTAGATLAAVGAALFMASDATLAVNRFRRPFRSAQAMILTTYYAAQLLIAWSVAVVQGRTPNVPSW